MVLTPVVDFIVTFLNWVSVIFLNFIITIAQEQNCWINMLT